jgi:GT2 family glycosyltransferase
VTDARALGATSSVTDARALGATSSVTDARAPGSAAGRPRWAAGIVNHGSYDELERCLASLDRQSWLPERIFVWDTGADPARLRALAAARPHVRFEPGTNVGYAGGANRVVEALRAVAEFVLVLNPDVELDAVFAERLIASAAADPRVALATGKLLRPDRGHIDSAGIRLPRHRRPRDRGSEQPDRGQFDRREYVDGASGAALLLRVAAIERLSIEGELFDERFFAYHEDTDLGWRARRLGHAVLYEPAAIAVHARGWRRAGRRRVPAVVRRHSFKNHYLQLVKNETAAGLLRNAPWLLGWEILRLGFVLLRDREMLPAYAEAWRELPVAWRRRRQIRERATGGSGR